MEADKKEPKGNLSIFGLESGEISPTLLLL